MVRFQSRHGVEELPFTAIERVLSIFFPQSAFAEVLHGHQLVTADNCSLKQSCICELRLLLLHTDILLPFPLIIVLLRLTNSLLIQIFSPNFPAIWKISNHSPSSSLLIHIICFLNLLYISEFYLFSN